MAGINSVLCDAEMDVDDDDGPTTTTLWFVPSLGILAVLVDGISYKIWLFNIILNCMRTIQMVFVYNFITAN